LNDRASSWLGGAQALKQHTREDQPEGHGHDDLKCRDDARQPSCRRGQPD
jgi:hypothetical protein